MAPTICSGKKRESRTLINSNIRRNGQGSHQLNPTLSNIVNYVAKGSLNARVSTSLRIKTHNQSDKIIGDKITTSNLEHHQQQFSFVSDNAVTSSRYSDTENSYDLRLSNETPIKDSIPPTYSVNKNSTTVSSPSSSTLPYEERRLCRYSSINTNNSENDATELFKENKADKDSSATIKTKGSQHVNSSNIRKHYYVCNDFDSEEEDEDQEEISSGGSDTDMDTDELQSMTSSDLEKSENSVECKSYNNRLLLDKCLVKQQPRQQQTDHNAGNNANDNRKPLANLSSTDDLLSIAIKTIKLVKRNQLLQQRLTQLQMETSEFIESVLANPENKHFRENMQKQCKRQEVVENI